MQRTIIAICRWPLFLFLTLLMLMAPVRGGGHDLLSAPSRTDVSILSHSARLQSLLDAAVREGLPGVSLQAEGIGINFQGTAGVANLITGEPLTANHVMYMASLGKTFTATVALQLCEEGRLGLETPITTWLPSEVTKRIPSSGKITLRHLLSHTAGLIDYMNDEKAWRADFLRSPQRQWTHVDILAYLYDKPLLFDPGTRYHYSNSNYILVGVIIEQVTGQPLHALIRNRILAPLGLKHTFNGQESFKNKKRAHGYMKRRGRIIDTYPWYSHYGLADSGMHSTPSDLALFLKSLFSTAKVLGGTMRTEMTNVPELGHQPSRYGMGIFVHWNRWGRGSWYAHDGIDPGYQADMIYFPDRNLAVVLAANASLGRASFIYEKLIMAVMQVVQDAVWGSDQYISVRG